MKVVILTGRRESLEDFVRGLGVDIDWAEEAVRGARHADKRTRRAGRYEAQADIRTGLIG
jgi:hypothetical protein